MVQHTRIVQQRTFSDLPHTVKISYKVLPPLVEPVRSETLCSARVKKIVFETFSH